MRELKLASQVHYIENVTQGRLRCVHTCTEFKRFDAVKVLMQGRFKNKRELCRIFQVADFVPIKQSRLIVPIGHNYTERENVYAAIHLNL